MCVCVYVCACTYNNYLPVFSALEEELNIVILYYVTFSVFSFRSYIHTCTHTHRLTTIACCSLEQLCDLLQYFDLLWYLLVHMNEPQNCVVFV